MQKVESRHFQLNRGQFLGSVRLLTNLDQSVLQNVDFLPFGELIGGSPYTSHEFTGDERDAETNLDHTWFRQYSSQLGRWMHPDPAGLAATSLSDPQTLNRYAYVRNSAVSAVDPTGLACYGPMYALGDCGGFTGNIPFGSTWNEFDVMSIPIRSSPQYGWHTVWTQGPSGTDYTSSIGMPVWGPLPQVTVGIGLDIIDWGWWSTASSTFVKGWFTKGFSFEEGSCTNVFAEAVSEPFDKLSEVYSDAKDAVDNLPSTLQAASSYAYAFAGQLRSLIRSGVADPGLGRAVITATATTAGGTTAAAGAIEAGGTAAVSYGAALSLDAITGYGLGKEIQAVRAGSCKF